MMDLSPQYSSFSLIFNISVDKLPSVCWVICLPERDLMEWPSINGIVFRSVRLSVWLKCFEILVEVLYFNIQYNTLEVQLIGSMSGGEGRGVTIPLLYQLRVLCHCTVNALYLVITLWQTHSCCDVMDYLLYWKVCWVLSSNGSFRQFISQY